jgi:anti-sigma factor (TIGR02949 family)
MSSDGCAQGSPGGVDCGDVLTRLPAFLDGEMSVTEAASFRVHVDACSPCLEELGIDQVVKSLVGRCCGGEAAPDQLRSKVVAELRASWTTVQTPAGVYSEIHTETVSGRTES